MDARECRYQRVAAVRARLATTALAAAVVARDEEARSLRTIARLRTLTADYRPGQGAAEPAGLRRFAAFGQALSDAADQAAGAHGAVAVRREAADAALREAEREVRLAEKLGEAARDEHRRAQANADLAAQSGTVPASSWTRVAIRQAP